MSRNVSFTPTGFEEYNYWVANDRKNIKKINSLIRSIFTNGPLVGEGKPERLKFISAYSRRIDLENRLVYRFKENEIIILSCRGHYNNL